MFREPFPDWKGLFAPVLPQHALAGEDFDEVWRDRIDNPKTGRPLASGPFIFESWNRGSRLTLARNRNYWKRKAYLDRLDFRFLLPDFGAQIRAVRAGEVDLIQGIGNVPPEDLRSSPGIRVLSGSTFFFEHIDFQLGSKGNPALKKPFVRQAIAYGIDRKSLTKVLYKAIAPGLKTDQSAIYLPFQPAYRPHWQRWSFSPAKAMRLLRAHGCRRGDDGIFSCQGQRLSFRFISTAGSPLRERTFEFIQPQLRRIGIDLVNAFGPRQLVLQTVLPSGDWDLALFSWGYGGDPAALVDVWGCKGSHNLHRVLQPEGDGAVPEGSIGAANEQAPTTSKPSRCPHGTGSPDPSALRQAGICDPQQPHPKCRVEPHRRSLERARLVDRPSVTAANLLALSPRPVPRSPDLLLAMKKRS